MSSLVRASKWVILAALLLPASCGEKKDPADGVSMRLSPNKSIVGPGPQSSCLDYHAKALSPDSSLIRSLQGPVISFNNFALTWDKSDEILYISTIRVTVEGVGIKDGRFVQQLSLDEVAAILGRDEGIVRTAGTYSTTDSDRSNLASTKYNQNYPTCGFHVSGVPLTDGTKTPSFKAKVTIDVIGTAQKNDDEGTLRFVRQKATGSADYIAY